jgi:hypothetical protein
MEFRDLNRESHYQQKKQAQLQKKVEFACAIRQQKYNIVSHQGNSRQIENIRRDQWHARPSHPISNLPHEDHLHAPLLYNEDYSLTKFRPNTTREKKFIAKQREFNVVSNEYSVNHDAKLRTEFDRLKGHVVKKYWATHDYDIIKGRYCSPEKEKQYKEQRETVAMVHGAAQMERIPPSAKCAYNIMTHEVLDDQRLEATMVMENRSLNRMKKLEKERIQKEEGELRNSVQEQLRLNKVSYKRWEKQLNRGYNFVNNETVSQPPAPLPERPATMWARLSGSAPINGAHNAAHSSFNQYESHAERSTPASKSRSAVLEAQANGNAENMVNTRVRNLSGSGTQFSTGNVPDVISSTAKAETSITSRTNDKSARAGKVPSLDLSRTEFAEPIKYSEPSQGPPGLAVSIVRTGGFCK